MTDTEMPTIPKGFFDVEVARKFSLERRKVLAAERAANLLNLDGGGFQHVSSDRVASGSCGIHLCPECERRLLGAALEQAINSINVRHLNRTGLLEHAFVYIKAFFKRVGHLIAAPFSRGLTAPAESVSDVADSHEVKTARSEDR